MRAMRRRDFITLVGGAAAAWPLAARAQQPAFPVVGILSLSNAQSMTEFISAFRRGLNEGGFQEHKNITLEFYWADDQPDRLPLLASELVNHHPAVIFAIGGS